MRTLALCLVLVPAVVGAATRIVFPKGSYCGLYAGDFSGEDLRARAAQGPDALFIEHGCRRADRSVVRGSSGAISRTQARRRHARLRGACHR